jgi:hypothetical protein
MKTLFIKITRWILVLPSAFLAYILTTALCAGFFWFCSKVNELREHIPLGSFFNLDWLGQGFINIISLFCFIIMVILSTIFFMHIGKIVAPIPNNRILSLSLGICLAILTIALIIYIWNNGERIGVSEFARIGFYISYTIQTILAIILGCSKRMNESDT